MSETAISPGFAGHGSFDSFRLQAGATYYMQAPGGWYKESALVAGNHGAIPWEYLDGFQGYIRFPLASLGHNSDNSRIPDDRFDRGLLSLGWIQAWLLGDAAGEGFYIGNILLGTGTPTDADVVGRGGDGNGGDGNGGDGSGGDGSGGDGGRPSNPDTSDSAMIGIAILVLLLSAGGIVFFRRKLKA
jgi:LPXTG-motif cell wall-anchored protein